MSSIKSFFQSFQKLDQHHHSDLLTQPRRLEAVIPVEAAQKVVNHAYDDGWVVGTFCGSGVASQLTGFALGISALVKQAARAAAVEAEASVIPATWYGAGAVVEFGGGAALASGVAPVAAAEGAAAVVVASAAAPFILPAFLFGTGVILSSTSVAYHFSHLGSHTVHGV
jgi:hypothetical protein